MRKYKNIFIGLAVPLLFHIATHINLLWEYDAKFSKIYEFALYALPAIPGIMLAFLLKRDSLRKFLSSCGICFVTSLCLEIVLSLIRFDYFTYALLSGFEMGNAEGLLCAIMFVSYAIACIAGTMLAGIATCFKSRKSIYRQSK